jgi:hypothetical protein
VARDASPADLEQARRRLESELERLTAEADHMAAGKQAAP